MTSQEIVTIIAAVSLAMVQIITAWRSSVAKERIACAANDKLDAIHTLANSNLATVQAELIVANDQIVKLESLLASALDARASK